MRNALALIVSGVTFSFGLAANHFINTFDVLGSLIALVFITSGVFLGGVLLYSLASGFGLSYSDQPLLSRKVRFVCAGIVCCGVICVAAGKWRSRATEAAPLERPRDLLKQFLDSWLFKDSVNEFRQNHRIRVYDHDWEQAHVLMKYEIGDTRHEGPWGAQFHVILIFESKGRTELKESAIYDVRIESDYEQLPRDQPVCTISHRNRCEMPQN